MTSIGKIRAFLEETLVRLAVALGVDEQVAHEAAAEAIEEDASLYDQRPMTIIFEAIDANQGDRYRFRAFLTADNGVTEYTGVATYREGVIKFTVQDEVGSRSLFEGTMAADNMLAGDFSITAWAVIRNAIVGEWSVARQP